MINPYILIAAILSVLASIIIFVKAAKEEKE